MEPWHCAGSWRGWPGRLSLRENRHSPRADWPDPLMSPADPTTRPPASIPPPRCNGRLADLAATQALARRIAACLVPGFVLYLSGGLGAGKTAFTRALLAALGHQGRVKSPTFALLEPYNLSKFDLHHYDFYRLEQPEAWRDAGFEASFDGRIVVVIEWPERAGNSLPAPDLHLCLEADAGSASSEARQIWLEATSERGRACLNTLTAEGYCNAVP